MNIGLIDVDGHNFPNLALMKLSAYYKQAGHCVEFADMFNTYDIVFKSKVFTFTPDDYTKYDAKKIVKGGTGYKNFNITLDDKIEYICPDYSLYNIDYAMGFLTRGCIRNCSFCVVPKKEGKIKPHQDISDFLADKKKAVLLDNNVLSCNFGIQQIEKIINLGIKVDFNQGLDARIINKSDYIVKLLSNVKWFKPLRMACDCIENLKIIVNVIKKLRESNVTPKKYFIYVIVNQEIDDALTIARELKKYRCDVFAQPFIDYNDNIEITRKQKDFCRWVNHKAIFNTIDFADYKYGR